MDAKITDAYLNTFPKEFQALHQYADFRALYEKAIEVSGLRNHPLLHQRPLNALDIGGGEGILGRMLRAEFENRVAYSNIDRLYNRYDNDFRIRCGLEPIDIPKEAIKGDIKDLDTLVSDGTTYDAMFVLNFKSNFQKGEYFRDRSSDEREFLFAHAMQINQLYLALIFAQAAFHLPKGGKLIEGGLFLDDALDGRTNFLEKAGLRFWHDGYSALALSPETALAFAKHDMRSDLAAKQHYLNEFYQPLKEVEAEVQGLAELYHQSFGIHVFTALENDKDHVKKQITDLRQKWGWALEQWGLQDRFCG